MIRQLLHSVRINVQILFRVDIIKHVRVLLKLGIGGPLLLVRIVLDVGLKSPEIWDHKFFFEIRSEASFSLSHLRWGLIKHSNVVKATSDGKILLFTVRIYRPFFRR